MAQGDNVSACHPIGTRQRYGSISYSAFLCPVLAMIGLYIFSTAFFLAKRSMPHISSCEKDSASNLLREWLDLTADEISRLQQDRIISAGNFDDNGCWTARRVDSMVVVVVDALRFDFARYHLPQSIGSRLKQEPMSISTSRGRSQILKFVADPPTVTMQRLKGLTTGGLPTFADISGSFGGATVDEDTWVQQLKVTLPYRRGLHLHDGSRSKLAFVGDDTWVDLFPTQFDDCHPYPSFNTRDLDTVDNGCLEHLPRLMQSLGRNRRSPGEDYGFEVVVAHFLGVDHVGHTYGPHNEHMDGKLRQMDAALADVLDQMDGDKSSHECQVAFVFGDHGMTEDGNHGGGTDNEINAALFAHFSPYCGNMSLSEDITGIETGLRAEAAFQTIHQIDLVPTISLLLGLPIPYANLGGLVPSLLPPRTGMESQTPLVTAALALNAAQVWRYFNVYSKTANTLPSLPELQVLLKDAVSKYKDALSQRDGQDSLSYRDACGKFKLFLTEATELGKRVWTRFDSVGMTLGGSILLVAVLLGIPRTRLRGATRFPSSRQSHNVELTLTLILMLFQCVILTFSNSYIEKEQNIITFSVGVICLAVSCRRAVLSPEKSVKEAKDGKSNTDNAPFPSSLSPWLPFVIAICTRLSELFITGHGMDPAIRLHVAHHSAVFLSSLVLLAVIRWQIYQRQVTLSFNHVMIDIMALFCLALSWVDKRSQDPSRNGYILCRAALSLLATGVCFSLFESFHPDDKASVSLDFETRARNSVGTSWFKLMLLIMTVTGPSTASSCVVFIVTLRVLYKISPQHVSDPVVAALCRLTMRHQFFATGHACAFNKLQYSAAFVATSEFYFGTGGASLFLNTFGWEILVSILVLTTSVTYQRRALWDWFYFYQLLETFSACVSVTLMRRHLMVWAVFAPRFVFAAIFLVLASVARLSALTLSNKRG